MCVIKILKPERFILSFGAIAVSCRMTLRGLYSAKIEYIPGRFRPRGRGSSRRCSRWPVAGSRSSRASCPVATLAEASAALRKLS